MKISEMTNDQAAQALIDLSAPIARICDDEDAVALVQEYGKNQRKPLFYVIGKILPRLLGYMLEKHKNELYLIISILSGKPYDEIGAMNFQQTVQIARESYDDVLKSFFISSVSATKDGAQK